jgi:predicted N-acetyltransferase YhbS
MKWEIRAALVADAADISRVILAALREINAKDYSSDVIQRVERSFGPDAVLEVIRKRKVFVAVTGGRIVGTASLQEQSVRTMFVAPDVQGQGVGKLLMAEVERAAREAGARTVVVPSAVTAVRFYSKLGFRAVGHSYHGQERTIIMERSLA